MKKNNEVGLITLKGEVYFDCAYKHLVVTDDGYIISNNVVYNKRKKIIYESSQYLINYFSYPEEYYFNWD